MHPALSVIVFTVASGAGFGLVALTLALELLGGVPGLGATGVLWAVAGGVVLATAGLLASTLHLANPKNAWRAFMRFRSSWLSREAVFSVLFYPVILLYFAGMWTHGATDATAWVYIAAVAALLLAAATVFTTGMIYASLRTIPQWHSALVPANYLLLGVASGAVLLTGIVAISGGGTEAVGQLAVTLVVLGGFGKAVYYYWIGQPQGPSINTALGMTRGRVRLLESGQSAPTFLDREFGYQAPASQLRWLRAVVYLAGFLLPLGMLLGLLATGQAAYAVLAVASMLGGLLVERWLFFAEARHTVNLFYGRQRC